MKHLLLLCFLGVALIWAGCDSTDDDGSVTVEGLVYDETLDRPAEGVRVVMAHPRGWFISPEDIVAEAETDATGRYRLEYDPGSRLRDYYRVRVNYIPLDSVLFGPEPDTTPSISTMPVLRGSM